MFIGIQTGKNYCGDKFVTNLIVQNSWSPLIGISLTPKVREAEGRGGAGMEGQRGDKGGVYSGGAHRATSNGVLMSMCELVASQINTLRELGSCEHAPARRSLR